MAWTSKKINIAAGIAAVTIVLGGVGLAAANSATPGGSSQPQATATTRQDGRDDGKFGQRGPDDKNARPQKQGGHRRH